MFGGEESVRIKSDLPREQLEDAIADSLDRLGDVKFSRGSEFKRCEPRGSIPRSPR
jgi:hypothetical protein